jgi:hypothetical protein
MNYIELFNTIQSYTENTFPDFTASNGETVTPTEQINRFIEQAELRIYNTVQFPSLRKNMTGNITSGNKYLKAPDDYLATYSLAVIDASGNYEYLLNKDVNFIRQSYPNPTTDVGTPKYYALFGPSVQSNVITNELTFILGPTPSAAYTAELHFYYYPVSIVQAVIASFGAVTGGSGYTNGLYYNVQLTGGSGSGAYADITVSGGVVTTVVIRNGGCLYKVGNALSAAVADIGGTGTGFSVPVATVTNVTGTSWLGDNFDTVLLYGSLVEAYTYMKGETDMLALYDGKYKEALAQAKRLGDGMERQDAYRSGQYRQAVT